MKFIDTHTHLYLDGFQHDRQQMIDRALAEGVQKMYLPAIDSSELEHLLALEKAFPGVCIPMMGLHPCSVKANYEDELRLVEEQLRSRRLPAAGEEQLPARSFAAVGEGPLKSRKFAAVGEIGLDFYWDVSFTEQQFDAFRRQVDWAGELGLPVVIHSRKSLDECIGVIREKQNGALKGIFHCFSGTVEQAMQVIELGFYLGIGGVVTYKNAGLAEVLVDLPLERMVLETDAPYLTPVPFRGKRNESSYIKYVAQRVAEVKGVSVEEVAAVTTANAENIFRFEG